MRAARQRAHTRKPPRPAPLAVILMVGIIAAAVVVADAMAVASMRGRTARFSSPLRVYPVKTVTPGLCPVTTPGINGQAASGPSCYQVDPGLAIRRVNDIHVESTPDGKNEISISLLPADRRAFASLTRTMAGRSLAFVVGDRLVTAPRVEAPVTRGKIILSGSPTRADADRLVRELTHGVA